MAGRIPVATLLLAASFIIVYFFTYQDISYYENIFGFKPAQPLSFGLITYSFIHADLFHLFFNVVLLLLVGFSAEKIVGSKMFLATYLISANIALMSDTIGRIFLGL